ncbi:glycoside hydrolase family 3 [Veillonella sp. S12025-13]|uniref:beta-N-acetylhexosaminidase n=1 Tax=Veillonella orientalis TaxID=2682455 RepID=A0ABM7HJK2_9FIRM|nr:glycoside hydrolase family 3 protein [Veillonella sp. S12025-13]BBU37286.1 glycoside hydrolase family 3 [Veillonella sp. S12025-13]
MFRRIVAATMIGALALTTGCGLHNPFTSKAEPVTYESVAQSELSPEEKVDKLVANMSDADKVGQLLMIGIHGKTLNDDAKFMLNEYRVGGIILFDRNMESKDQVKSLITDINKTGKSAGLTPLFIGIDQEGGAVARMEDQLIKVPPAEELGKEPIEQAVSLAKQSGTELKDLGFNINFAPVADLGLTYGRSFSTNPDDVVRYASAVGKAYDEAGLWYSYKHFPGIGKTDVDLHADTSVVPVSKETLLNEDTKVFVDLIKQSKPNTYAIMVSHAMYPQIDAEHPSSLSKAIITDWLRKDMGYNGVVVTDDMDMGALAKHYTFGDMAVQSILAGSDILLVCHEYEHMQEAYNGLMKAVKDGRISKERLDESVKRILLMKITKIS